MQNRWKKKIKNLDENKKKRYEFQNKSQWNFQKNWKLASFRDVSIEIDIFKMIVESKIEYKTKVKAYRTILKTFWSSALI